MAGYKVFANNELLTAAEVNDYLMRQAEAQVADQAERDAIMLPSEGQRVWRLDAQRAERYLDGAWRPAEGLILLAKASGTNVASLSIDDVFTDRFERYKITAHLRLAALQTINARMRAGGSGETGSAAYNQARTFLSSSSAASGAQGQAAAWTPMAGGANEHDISLELQGMRSANDQVSGTGITQSRGGSVSAQVTTWGGHMNNTDNYDGIQLYAASGTMSGDMAVYGYC